MFLRVYEPSPFVTLMMSVTMPVMTIEMFPLNLLLVVTFTVALSPVKISSTLAVRLRSRFLTSNMPAFASALNASSPLKAT